MKTVIKVKNVTTGEEFSSLNAAAKHYGTRVQVFSMLYRGKFASYKGNTFQFEKVIEETVRVRCIESDNEWDSCYMASKHFNVLPSVFYQMYKKGKNTCKSLSGLHFEFIR